MKSMNSAARTKSVRPLAPLRVAAAQRGFSSAVMIAVLAATLVILAMSGCHESEPTMGSETHFLRSCAALCPEGSDCACGVCTKTCSAASECAGLDAQATCVATAPRISEGRCVESTQAAVCDVVCVTDADCAAMDAGFSCQAGFCRGKVDSSPSNENQSTTTTCVPPTLGAQDILVMGDAHIELTSFVARLEEHATSAGVIQAGEHLRDYASATTSWLASSAGTLTLDQQYSGARQEGSARIIIMDGGETDLLGADCGTDLTYNCPSIKNAVIGAQRLLQRFADDRVEHVVYFFYPDPRDNPKLKNHLDALRPLIRNVCGQASVACHWIDLRDSFAGRDDYLNAENGIIISETGASVAAGLVWERMQARCLVPSG